MANDNTEATGKPTVFSNALILVGGAALLLAMFTDTVAVAGRHLGIPLLGAIEAVRAFAAIAAISAVMLTTLRHAHAHVHFLTDRIPDRYSDLLDRISQIVSFVFFLILLAGSVWLMLDLLPGHERSEVIGIPYPPLRAFTSLGCFITALLFLRHAFGRKPS